MNRDTRRQIAVVLAFTAMIVVNALASALPLNGKNTGEISDQFAIYFVPAGYVFAIWGIISRGLLGFTAYQALPAQRENPRLREVGYLFVLSSVANIVWLFLWHYEVFTLTLIAMAAILLSLIAIYLRLGTGRTAASGAERWLVRVPFSVYLGWITVATIANASQLLFYIGWGGWGISPQTWTVIMLAAAVVIASLMALTRRDIAYLLVLVWAFVGIALKHTGAPLVVNAAWVATVLVGVAIVASLLRHNPTPRKLPA